MHSTQAHMHACGCCAFYVCTCAHTPRNITRPNNTAPRLCCRRSPILGSDSGGKGGGSGGASRPGGSSFSGSFSHEDFTPTGKVRV